MSEAFAALLGAFIGGGMVVLSEVLARRAEDRRRWLERMHDAASELIHYEWHREVVASNSRRPEGDITAGLEERFGQERRMAASKLWTLPDADDVRERMLELMGKTNALTDAASADEAEFQRRRSEHREAIERFERTVQEKLKAN